MKRLDTFEKDILAAYEKGELKSTSPSKAALAKFKESGTGSGLYCCISTLQPSKGSSSTAS